MKWTNCAASVLAMLMATAAWGAAPLSNTLKGFSGDTSLAGTQAALAAAGLNVFDTSGHDDNGTPDPGDDSNPAIAFDSAGAHIGSLVAGDGGRNYLRTNGSDYATTSFTAEITFEVTADAQDFFFGLGAGDRALFGTPDWSTQLSSASFWAEARNDKFVAFKTANDINAFVDRAVPGFDLGVHRFRMTFDAVTGFLVGSIDLNYAGGPFVADATSLPVATKAGASPQFAVDGWPSEPSRIFIGGDDGVIVSDLTITVVPEPAAATLAVLGVLAALGRRARR